jgi:hypothetical protein
MIELKKKTFSIEKEPVTALLVSMATRYHHDFLMDQPKEYTNFNGLGSILGYTPESRKVMIEIMKKVYDCVFDKYVKNNDLVTVIPQEPELDVLVDMTAILQDISRNEVIHDSSSGKLVSAKQIYEEISGTGFYSKDRDTSLYDVAISF